MVLNFLKFLVLFAIQPAIVQNIENWNFDNRRNFKILYEIMSNHFNNNKETMVVTKFPYKYLSELAKELQNFDFLSGIILTNQTRKNYNNLIFDVEDLYLRDELIDDNVLVYYDYRDFDCETSARIQAKRLRGIEREETWYWFRTIFMFEYSTECNSSYELWTREPWKRRFPPRKISNIQAAYFNRKPNYHGEELAFVNSQFRSGSITDGKTLAIKEYMLNYFNIKEIPFEWRGRYLVFEDEPTQAKPFNSPFEIMAICAVVQKGAQFPPWQALTRCFEPRLWLSLLCSWVISASVWWIIRDVPTFDSAAQMLSLLSASPTVWIGQIYRLPLRLFVIGVMLISIVVSSGLQSQLYSNLQTPGSFPSINSVSELHKANYTLLCTNENLCKIIFGHYYRNPLLIKIGKNWRNNGTPTLNDVYYNPNKALIIPCRSARNSIKLIKKFQTSLHILRAKLAEFYLCFYSTTFTFPFQSKFQQIIASFYESGIAEWHETNDEWKRLVPILFEEESHANLRAFSLYDLQIAFIILLIGEMLAFVVFLCENMFNRLFTH